jgi:hypothetical protein
MAKANDRPHAGDVSAVEAYKHPAYYLAQIVDYLAADRGVDTPADATDYRDIPVDAAAGDLYLDTATQFSYVYLPNIPRNLTIYSGARGQYLGFFREGQTVQLRIPRALGLTLVYEAGAATETLTVVFSVRPLELAVTDPIAGLLRSGSTYDSPRTANVFNTISATASGNSAIWTPATGKKFRLMGYLIEVTGNAAQAAGGHITMQLRDGAAGATGLQHNANIPAVAGTGVVGYSTGWVGLGNGYLSTAAGNVLNLNLSANLTGGVVRVVVAGTED